MASKGASSKDTARSTTRDAVEKVSMSLLIYKETKLLVDNNINFKWQDINDTFSGIFGQYLEDYMVYVNIHKYGLYQITCRYPAFPCMDMIHWIISQTDSKMMVLLNISEKKISTFRVKDFQQMYNLPHLMITMETPFNRCNNTTNSKDILKS